MASSTFSVFGADTRITGDVSASADLHIDGRVEGDVTCTDLGDGGQGLEHVITLLHCLC